MFTIEDAEKILIKIKKDQEVATESARDELTGYILALGDAMCVLVCSCEKGNTLSTSSPENCIVHGTLPKLTVAGGREGEIMQDKNVPVILSISDSNHLRRLLEWMSCEIGQAPEEMINTLSDISPAIGEVSREGKERISQSYQKSKDVPKYIRNAIKALKKKV